MALLLPVNFGDLLGRNTLCEILDEAIRSSDDPEPVRRAIRDGFDVDKHGTRLLHVAIRQNRFEIVRAMLEASADRDCLVDCPMLDTLDEPFCRGSWKSPLSVACTSSTDSEWRRKMVELLLEHGASVKFDPERHSESCAHAALKYADCELLELLVRSGADLNCLDRVIRNPDGGEEGGNTPLHKVSDRQYPTESELRLEVMQKLLELGADVNVANIRGSTAMHLMFEGQLSNHQLAEKSDEVLTLLLNAKAELNRLNDSGESPLSLAAKCGSYQMVQRMIDAGANVNLSEGSTNPALRNAIVGAHIDIVKLLLDCGADINVKDDDGKNIMWAAAEKWNENKAAVYIDILKLIMDHNANKNRIVFEKYVGYVLESGSMEAMQLFIENGVRVDNCGVQFPLHRAAANSGVEILDYLLKTRLYDVDAVDKTGTTALFNAILYERLDCVRALVEWGANVNIPTGPQSEIEAAERSPLSQAVSKGNLEMVDLLLSFGAKIHLDCGSGEKRCFLSTLHNWLRINRSNLTVLNLQINWKCMFGRAVLSQSHAQTINSEMFIPELDNWPSTWPSNEPSRWPFHLFLFRGELIRSKLDECLSELDALKSVCFYKDRHNLVTLFDLLLGREITHYMNNAQVLSKYNFLGVKERFPIYGNLIETRFSIARFKRKLMDKAAEKLRKTFESHFWNRDWFLYKIMTHFSIRDLRNLSEM
ncbi:hypothetical protein QAD02_024207 [Eretmocerus hayati]|uniref:Uncharacterized protein n=1 Tax=Eretmocerus hayati TaxID=131215 RepID=A0ACC2PYF4_9HYME|nr:hypothetical protein QAD02_024207 [Eretmocerus hayati]